MEQKIRERAEILPLPAARECVSVCVCSASHGNGENTGEAEQ